MLTFALLSFYSWEIIQRDAIGSICSLFSFYSSINRIRNSLAIFVNLSVHLCFGVKWYEREYRDSIKHNYPREGEGEEYDTDGKSLIYHGYYLNGKRQGQGKAYKNNRSK